MGDLWILLADFNFSRVAATVLITGGFWYMIYLAGWGKK